MLFSTQGNDIDNCTAMAVACEDYVSMSSYTDPKTEKTRRFFWGSTQYCDAEDEVPTCVFESQWTTLSLDLTGYRSVTLYMGLQSNTVSEYVRWDDVLFTSPVPMYDFCESGPCQNGANCSMPLYRYRYDCNCTTGFEGYNCEHLIVDECASNPCQNNGTCTDGIREYSCVCTVQYGLTTFPQDDSCFANAGLVAFTSFNEPSTGATSFISSTPLRHSTEMGFTVLKCTGTANPSSYGVTAFNQFSASATNEFCYSELDALDVADLDWVTVSFQLFLARTSWSSGSYIKIWIEVDDGFDIYGAPLSMDIVLLSTEGYDLDQYAPTFGLFEGNWVDLSYNISTNQTMVLHYGLRSATSSEYLLLDEVMFLTAEHTADFCASTPCQNGGVCITPLFFYRYICECPADYEGYDCEHVSRPECASQPCQNGGTCIDTGIQEYRCVCPVLFDLQTLPLGDNCELAEDIVAFTSFSQPTVGSMIYDSPGPAMEIGFETFECQTSFTDDAGNQISTTYARVTSSGQFRISDSEALCYVRIDPVDLSSFAGSTGLQVQLYVASADWTDADTVQVWIEIDGGEVVSLVDTTGIDIDDPVVNASLVLTEGSWNTLTVNLTGNSTVTAYLGLQSSSITKYVAFDDFIVTADEPRLVYCASVPCENGGTCVADPGCVCAIEADDRPACPAIVSCRNPEPYSCICAQGYDGGNCQYLELNECASDPCTNGGVCVDLVQTFACTCPVLFGLNTYTLDDRCRSDNTIVAYTTFSEPGTAAMRHTSSYGGELGFIDVGCHFAAPGSGVRDYNAYQISSPGQFCYLRFDQVEVPSTVTTVTISFELYVSESNWGAEDYIKVWVEVAPGVFVDILDSTGVDVDDLGLVEGAWNTVTQDFTGHSTLTLYIGLNANGEAIAFRELMMTTTTVPPNFCIAAPCQNSAICSIPPERFHHACECVLPDGTVGFTPALPPPAVDGWHRLVVTADGNLTTFYLGASKHTTNRLGSISPIFSIGNDYETMNRAWGFMSRFSLYNDSLLGQGAAELSQLDFSELEDPIISIGASETGIEVTGSDGFHIVNDNLDRVVNIIGSPAVVTGPSGGSDGMHFGAADVLILGRGGINVNASWTIDLWFQTPFPFTAQPHSLLRALNGDLPVMADGASGEIGCFLQGHVGWEGPNCDVERADHCASSPCSGTAICIDGITDYSCICEEMYGLRSLTLDASCTPLFDLIAYTGFSDPRNGASAHTVGLTGELGFTDLSCTFDTGSYGDRGVTLDKTYKIASTQQFCQMSFSEVLLHALEPSHVQLELFIAKTVWAAEDFMKLWITTNDGTVITVLDTQNTDMNAIASTFGLELGAWTPLRADLSGHTSAEVHLGLRSSDAASFILLDELLFTTWSLKQSTIAYTSFALPVVGDLAYTSTDTFSFDMFAPTVAFPATEIGFVDGDGVTPTCTGNPGVTANGYLQTVNTAGYCFFTFDEFEVLAIAAPAATEVVFDISVYLSDAVWDAGDYIKIWVKIDNVDRYIIDTQGFRLEEYAARFGLEEGAWKVLRTGLSNYATGYTTRMQLFVGVETHGADKIVSVDQPSWSASLQRVEFCGSSPCLNGGTCVQPLHHFVCQCAASFEGTQCDTATTDECASSPCLAGGECVDMVNTYRCICPQYYGLWTLPLDHNCQAMQSLVAYTSFSDPAVNAASYVTPNRFGELGFTADASTGCSFLGGYGVTATGYYELRNAVSTLCNVHMDTVTFDMLDSDSPALFEFRIFIPDVPWDEEDGIVVALTLDGTDTQTVLDTRGSDLNVNASLFNLQLGAWSTIESPSNLIGGHSTLSTQIGFQSHNTEQYVLLDDLLVSTWLSPHPDFMCLSAPCQNGGTCVMLEYRYLHRCDCAAGFEGNDCEFVEVEECASNPCRNDGVCVDGVNAYTCTCPPLNNLALLELDGHCAPTSNLVAYTSFSEPATAAVEYTSHGNGTELGFTSSGCVMTTFDGIGEYGITASGEFKFSDTDALCLVELDPVRISGVPVVKIEMGVYISESEWTDDDAIRIVVSKDGAETVLMDTAGYDLDMYAWRFNLAEQQWAHLAYFVFGGTVDEVTVTFGAHVSDGGSYAHTVESNLGSKIVLFSEVFVTTNQLRSDFCASFPCGSNGACRQPLFLYECVCDAGFEGDNCEFAVADECSSRPCLNGGTCVDGAQSYTCLCPAITAGSDCETVTCASFDSGSGTCLSCSGSDYAFADGSCRAIDGHHTAGSRADIQALFSGLQANIVTHRDYAYEITQNVTGESVAIPAGNSIFLFGDRAQHPLLGSHVDLQHCTVAFVSLVQGADLHVQALVLHGATAGVISATGGAVVLNSVYLLNNTAEQGGVIFSQRTDLTISRADFVRNSAAMGGVMHCSDSALVISSSTFNGNSARQGVAAAGRRFLSEGSAGDGGAIYFNKTDIQNPAQLIVADTSFISNNASGSGGAVYLYGAMNFPWYTVDYHQATFQDVTFSGNGASVGGAVASANSFPHGSRKKDYWFLRIHQTQFTGNEASIAGGAISASDTTVRVFDVNFEGNAARGEHGMAHRLSLAFPPPARLLLLRQLTLAAPPFSSSRWGSPHGPGQPVREPFHVQHKCGQRGDRQRRRGLFRRRRGRDHQQHVPGPARSSRRCGVRWIGLDVQHTVEYLRTEHCARLGRRLAVGRHGAHG